MVLRSCKNGRRSAVLGPNSAKNGQIQLDKETVVNGEEQWPDLWDLPPDQFEGKIRMGITYCMKEAPDTTFPDMLTALDRTAGEEYAYSEQRKAARAQAGPAETQKPGGESRAPERNPAETAEANRVIRTTLSNVDQSASSPLKRRLEQNERIEAAARAMPDDWNI